MLINLDRYRTVFVLQFQEHEGTGLKSSRSQRRQKARFLCCPALRCSFSSCLGVSFICDMHKSHGSFRHARQQVHFGNILPLLSTRVPSINTPSAIICFWAGRMPFQFQVGKLRCKGDPTIRIKKKVVKTRYAESIWRQRKRNPTPSSRSLEQKKGGDTYHKVWPSNSES